jgi:hypothetical protein
MPRHDRAYGVWSSTRGRGPARGRGVMKRRRQDAGMTRDEFAKLLRRLGVRGRDATA